MGASLGLPPESGWASLRRVRKRSWTMASERVAASASSNSSTFIAHWCASVRRDSLRLLGV